VGVRPDVALPATLALDVAYGYSLRSILKRETDPDYRRELEQLLLMIEKAARPRPDYIRP